MFHPSLRGWRLANHSLKQPAFTTDTSQPIATRETLYEPPPLMVCVYPLSLFGVRGGAPHDQGGYKERETSAVRALDP